MVDARAKRFRSVVTTDAKRRVIVPLPFDPDDAWGPKDDHRVGGTIDGHKVRAIIERTDDQPAGSRQAQPAGSRQSQPAGSRQSQPAGSRQSQHFFVLGPAWRRDCGVAPGDRVGVVLTPEGPQREDLPDDVAAAFAAAELGAGAFFDSLAQFYRRGYLRWIDATKNRPEVRAQRIDDVVSWCSDGIKERPRAATTKAK
jgi:hypothetical protein